MSMQDVVLKSIEKVFQDYSIISIAGESGTGKTSLALFLVGQSLNFKNSCFWIQVSESFPKNRLISMYKDQKEKCDYLLNNVYITPSKVISLYSEQNNLLGKIANNKFLFPPDLRFIVIDNISHHLRFEISKVDDIRKRTSILDGFYDNILCPLILRCQRESITLILLHEVSFNIKCNEWTKDGKTSYFTSLDAWKVFSVSQDSTSQEPTTNDTDDLQEDWVKTKTQGG